MRHFRLIIWVAVLAMFVPSVSGAQMMHGNGMGGGRNGMINLVSPADSPTQIRRGSVAIASYISAMMGAAIAGPHGSGTPGLRVMLRLYGVTDIGGLVTSAGNHLIFQGQLTTPTGKRTPISIDQLFALNAGAAAIQVPVSMPSVTGPATIVIDRVAVEDSSGNAFAVPGVSLTQPIPLLTPVPTPQITPQPTGDPVAAGRRIFTSGIGTDGRPIARTGGYSMMMMVSGCAGCHGFDGHGLHTMMFTAPNVTYSNLTDPSGMREPDGSRGPTYTDDEIRRAVVQGIDPENQTLATTMPRWQMSDQDWNDLLLFLKTLH
ncbi:MAG: c-type cytochrome [Deltaproteobacteria bacterium]|nr:c-type cytochrome [Deltaproteobacteria bacterium]